MEELLLKLETSYRKIDKILKNTGIDNKSESKIMSIRHNGADTIREIRRLLND